MTAEDKVRAALKEGLQEIAAVRCPCGCGLLAGATLEVVKAMEQLEVMAAESDARHQQLLQDMEARTEEIRLRLLREREDS